MDENKIYDLLTRLVENVTPGAGATAVDECWDLLVRYQQEAEYQDWSDLQHVTNVVYDELEPPQGSRFVNLMNRLAALQDDGVIRRPAEMVHLLRLLNGGQQEPAMRIPTQIDDNEPETHNGTSVGDIISQLHQQQSPPNGELLQDLPYALQGLKTNSFAWNTEGGATRLDLPGSIPFPLMGLLNQLLEPAMLYNYLIHHLEDRKAGLVKQSLFSAIHEELQSYLTLVGVIENQVRRQEESQNQDGRVTLRRCVVLLQEATLGLRLLYTIVQQAEDKIGGQILSLLHSFSYNGDELIAKFCTRLLSKVSKPFYETLNQWISAGSLVDPHGEFFIKIKDSSSSWEGRFECDGSLQPQYMSDTVANRVVELGKTLYFLKSACSDTAWVDKYKTQTPQVSDYEELTQYIDSGYAQAVERLNTVLKTEFLLDLHLQGLKDYLLLGKGDFVQVLVETVAPVLDKPANRLLRHHLTSTLETAIRASNAQFDNSEVLRSLDARMLELGHGDIGWDVFTLDYHVDKPLDVVILNKTSMTEYLRVFNFLWRVKRVSYSLYFGWRRLSTGDRRVLSKQHKLKAQWHQVRIVYQEMLHFISEMQYYINYEVVEMAWSELQRKLVQTDPPLTVDEIIRAHQQYLGQITHKGLLGGGESLMGELHEVLKTMLSFRDSIDGLYDTAVRIELDATQANQDRFNTIYNRILELKQQFEKSVTRLVRDLGRQDDSEMRFLGVRLDFNRFYSLKS